MIIMLIRKMESRIHKLSGYSLYLQSIGLSILVYSLYKYSISIVCIDSIHTPYNHK